MQRLTERIDNVPDGESGVWVKQHDYISAAEKLADYEDAEEQGFLLRLPISKDTPVYSIEYCCGNNKINRSGMCFRGFCENCSDKAYYIRESVAKHCSICEINKSVFFTREEAETKLKEMENRFLYRGKRTLTDNMWVYWDGFSGVQPNTVIEEKTICQCTGLKDKNGKLIWENDIVDCHIKRGAVFRICVVLWNECKARFDIRAVDCNFPMTLDECVDGLDYEVLGNKFDNPELLEVQL